MPGKYLFDERGAAHLVVVVLLVMGIMVGVTVIQSPIIFSPKAAEEDGTSVTGQSFGGSGLNPGQPSRVPVKTAAPVATTAPTPVPTPIPTQAPTPQPTELVVNAGGFNQNDPVQTAAPSPTPYYTPYPSDQATPTPFPTLPPAATPAPSAAGTAYQNPLCNTFLDPLCTLLGGIFGNGNGNGNGNNGNGNGNQAQATTPPGQADTPAATSAPNPGFFNLVYTPPVQNQPTSGQTASGQGGVNRQAEQAPTEQKLPLTALSASSSKPFNQPNAATDGDPATDWKAAAEGQQYIDLDLKNVYKLTELRLLVSQSSSGRIAKQSNHAVCVGTDPAPTNCQIKFVGLTTDNKWLTTDEVKNYGLVRYIRIWTYQHPEAAAWREIEVSGLMVSGSTLSPASGSGPLQGGDQPVPAATSSTILINEFDPAFANTPEGIRQAEEDRKNKISNQNPAVRISKFFEELVEVLLGK